MKRNILYTGKSFEELKNMVQDGFTYQGLYQVVNDSDNECIEINIDEIGCYYVKLYKVDSNNWITDDNFDSGSINLNDFETLEKLFEDMGKHL